MRSRASHWSRPERYANSCVKSSTPSTMPTLKFTCLAGFGSAIVMLFVCDEKHLQLIFISPQLGVLEWIASHDETVTYVFRYRCSEITLADKSLVQHELGQQLWRSTALREYGVECEPSFANSKHGPVKLHVEHGVGRLFKLDNTTREIHAAPVFLRIESQRQRHGQQHGEAMRGALHAQHHALKLKPIREWRTVERQFVGKRNKLEACPAGSIHGVERLDASITPREKVLPEVTRHARHASPNN